MTVLFSSFVCCKKSNKKSGKKKPKNAQKLVFLGWWPKQVDWAKTVFFGANRKTLPVFDDLKKGGFSAQTCFGHFLDFWGFSKPKTL